MLPPYPLGDCHTMNRNSIWVYLTPVAVLVAVPLAAFLVLGFTSQGWGDAGDEPVAGKARTALVSSTGGTAQRRSVSQILRGWEYTTHCYSNFPGTNGCNSNCTADCGCPDTTGVGCTNTTGACAGCTAGF